MIADYEKELDEKEQKLREKQVFRCSLILSLLRKEKLLS
jgi:hypothetical protein